MGCFNTEDYVFMLRDVCIVVLCGVTFKIRKREEFMFSKIFSDSPVRLCMSTSIEG